MNIIYICHYAGSPKMGMAFRPYYLAKEWIKRGHIVNIIAADYSHQRRINPIVKEDFQHDVIDGINYYWIKTNEYQGNGAKRAMTMAKFVSKIWLNAKHLVDMLKPDIVICSSTYPLDTFAGQRIKKKAHNKVQLIHEIHDMWPASIMSIGGMSKYHPFVVAMQIGENSFCKNADKVVSLLPAAKNYLVEHGMKPDKFIHISNGVILEEWEKPDELRADIKEHLIKGKEEGKFNICFFGSIHRNYNLDILIEAVASRKKDDVRVTFIGPGHDIDELKRLTNEVEERFAFFDQISKTMIPSLFEYIDATFIGMKDEKLAQYGTSMNKLFDSMMGGKPILYMLDDPSRYIDEYNCGISLPNNSSDDLNFAIDKLINMNFDERGILGNNGRKAAIEVFNFRKLAEKFETVFEVIK